jgi:hypothetical protein
LNVDEAKRDLSPSEFSNFTFKAEMFNQGIEKDVSEEVLRRWMSNPELYKKELSKYAMYQYISNGDIFQLFDLVRIMPSLNYRIKTLKVNSRNDKHSLECRRALKSINHKELTRDILTQTISVGTLVGLWVGKENKKSKDYPYLMIFDDLEYFFPARRVGGKWTVWCDLSYFDKISDLADKIDMISNLDPYVTIEDYKNYKEKGDKYKYIEFPIERSVCIRTHTLKRNQRFGMPWNTQAIEDIKHKQKLRNLEKVASNKVMNAVAVLTLGIKDSEKSSYKALGEKITKSVFDNVKQGLMDNVDGEASVVGLPEWAKLEYPDQKTDVLNPDKIESVNEDVNNATGLSRTLTNGKGGNYASAKLNIDIIFNRIGELLETIESEVYNKLIKIILPDSIAEDYYMEYEKSSPLTNKEKVDTLYKLVSMGYSLRPLVELIGLDFDDYIENSIWEIDNLKLREKISPPLNTNNLSTEDNVSGRPKNDNETNENTIKSKEQNGNDSPDANT